MQQEVTFSSVSQTDELYRFRTIDSLMGKHKELHRQTIYLARPDQLNDVAEDTVNVVWRGDEILWSNLTTYYWRSLAFSTMSGEVCLPGYNYVLEEDSPYAIGVELEARRLAEFYKDTRAQIVENLVERQQPVSSYALQSALGRVTPNRIRTLLNAPIQPFDGFPAKFVQTMGKMLLSEYAVACFTKDYTNPFLWTTYADSNAGVCLVFNRELLKKTTAPANTSGVELADVVYRREKPAVEFFSNLPKMTEPEYRSLFTDENDRLSPLCPFLPKDREAIGKANQTRLRLSRDNLLTKHKQWEVEQEVRMFSISPVFLGEFSGPPSAQTVQYPIEALKGIIFGARVSGADKREILEVILSKHYAAPIKGDFWFEIAQPQVNGTMLRKPYDPYVSWKHK